MAYTVQTSRGFRRARDQLVAAIDARLEAVRDSGLSAEDLGDLGELAAKVAAVIPSVNPLAEVVGPCYDTPTLVQWLGISKQALDKRNRSGTVLGCRTRDGYWVYPAFQFDAQGRALPHLRDVLDALGREDDPARWRAAQWLAAPNPDLPGQVSSATWLRHGNDPGPVLSAARADAARWAA